MVLPHYLLHVAQLCLHQVKFFISRLFKSCFVHLKMLDRLLSASFWFPPSRKQSAKWPSHPYFLHCCFVVRFLFVYSEWVAFPPRWKRLFQVLLCSAIERTCSTFIRMFSPFSDSCGFLVEYFLQALLQIVVQFPIIPRPNTYSMLICIFRTNTLSTKILVCVENSYCNASPFGVFHNCCSASIFSCFREKNLNSCSVFIFL